MHEPAGLGFPLLLSLISKLNTLSFPRRKLHDETANFQRRGTHPPTWKLDCMLQQSRGRASSPAAGGPWSGQVRSANGANGAPSASPALEPSTPTPTTTSWLAAATDACKGGKLPCIRYKSRTFAGRDLGPGRHGRRRPLALARGAAGLLIARSKSSIPAFACVCTQCSPIWVRRLANEAQAGLPFSCAGGRSNRRSFPPTFGSRGSGIENLSGDFRSSVDVDMLDDALWAAAGCQKGRSRRRMGWFVERRRARSKWGNGPG